VTRARGAGAALAAIVTALAFASAAATCRGSEGERTERAVPAEVDLDWPDAAVMPPPPRAAPADAGA
jgi:hypothetical protein